MGKHWSEVLSCSCGATFRTPIEEAKHRHNFPILCRKANAAKIGKRQILAKIGEPKLDIIRVTGGGGYWYWEYDDIDNGIYETRSVMTPRLIDMPVGKWVSEGQAFVADVKRDK